MGIADFAFTHPSSFKKRKQFGEPIEISLDGEGLARDATGKLLFTLATTDSCFELLDKDKTALLRTSPGSQKGSIDLQDKDGHVLTTLLKHSFIFDSSTYTWKPSNLLSMSGKTTFVLKEASKSSSSGEEVVLATLKLTSRDATPSAKLTVEPAASGVPLGIILFQALMIEHSWSSLKVGLTPLKKLAFASNWI